MTDVSTNAMSPTDHTSVERHVFAIRARGYARCREPENVVERLLGPGAWSLPIEMTGEGWRVEDALLENDVVGGVRSVLELRPRATHEARIVPGSQGQLCPPPEAGHAIVSLPLVPGLVLLVDGRCWYWASSRQHELRLWVSRPRTGTGA
jgi:hypothetical protein